MLRLSQAESCEEIRRRSNTVPFSSLPRCYAAVQDLPAARLEEAVRLFCSLQPRLSGRLPQALGGKSLGKSLARRRNRLALGLGVELYNAFSRILGSSELT